jgi:hypothetical protein
MPSSFISLRAIYLRDIDSEFIYFEYLNHIAFALTNNTPVCYSIFLFLTAT